MGDRLAPTSWHGWQVSTNLLTWVIAWHLPLDMGDRSTPTTLEQWHVKADSTPHTLCVSKYWVHCHGYRWQIDMYLLAWVTGWRLPLAWVTGCHLYIDELTDWHVCTYLLTWVVGCQLKLLTWVTVWHIPLDMRDRLTPTSWHGWQVGTYFMTWVSGQHLPPWSSDM